MRPILSSGSSPRMRGKDKHVKWADVLRRFIPAYAGEGAFFSLSLASRSVHPRVCGGRRLSSRPRLKTYGSSPRMRGKDFLEPFVFITVFNERNKHRFACICFTFFLIIYNFIIAYYLPLSSLICIITHLASFLSIISPMLLL